MNPHLEAATFLGVVLVIVAIICGYYWVIQDPRIPLWAQLILISAPIFIFGHFLLVWVITHSDRIH